MIDWDYEELAKFSRIFKIVSVDRAVELMLFELGFKSNLNGTAYLIDCVILAYGKPIRSLCKDLYPEVATKHKTSVGNVERSVRRTIAECYHAGRLSLLNRVLNYECFGNYPPTNSEFIYAIKALLNILTKFDDIAI